MVPNRATHHIISDWAILAITTSFTIRKACQRLTFTVTRYIFWSSAGTSHNKFQTVVLCVTPLGYYRFTIQSLLSCSSGHGRSTFSTYWNATHPPTYAAKPALDGGSRWRLLWVEYSKSLKWKTSMIPSNSIPKYKNNVLFPYQCLFLWNSMEFVIKLLENWCKLVFWTEIIPSVPELAFSLVEKIWYEVTYRHCEKKGRAFHCS